MKQISILGCGWLGFPLAVSLQKKGFVVKGSTTSKDKLQAIQEAQVEAFLISLSSDGVEGNIHSFLNGSQLLIIAIPPKMRGDFPERFSEKITLLMPLIEKSRIKQLLFVSSTSVFGEFQGETDENTPPLPETISGKDLLKTEELLLKNKNFKTTVVRFGGLIGEDRHPVNYIAGRKNLSGGNAPVNLIHQADCIGIIEAIIQQNTHYSVIHGVHPQHPLKRDYYAKKAAEKKLEPPQYSGEDQNNHKIVKSSYLSESLNYIFKETI